MSGSFAIIDLVFNSAMLIELANDNEIEISGRGLNRLSFSRSISSFTSELALIALVLKLSMCKPSSFFTLLKAT